MNYSETLGVMIGKVKSFRPDVSALQCQNWINDRIREVLDSRIVWADLLGYTVLSSPASYATGTINTTTGSATVTGAGTLWPVSDVVNTTFPNGVPRIGYVEITPALMTGIKVDTLLYVDGSGPNPEAVAVVQVGPTSFWAKFQFLHNNACTATCSSLAGLQFSAFRGAPVYSIMAIIDAQTLLLEVPWAGAPLSASTYTIKKMYYTIDPAMKEIMEVVDPQFGGKPLELHVSQGELNFRDPQRTSTGPPDLLADWKPSPAGTMMYELWPPQTVQYQLPCLFTKQWPELLRDSDRPPFFINPTVFVHGAIADALRWKKSARDPYHNPVLARDYDTRYQESKQYAINDNESKAIRALQYMYTEYIGRGNSDYCKSHDPDVDAFSF